MAQSSKETTTSRRDGERKSFDQPVTVRIESSELVGSGQNISPQGVFFVAESTVRVWVRIEGSDEERAGELLRVQSMGDGKVGVAIRFDPSSSS